jgi:hypothetical protein
MFKMTTASAWLVEYANIYNPIFQHWVQTYQKTFFDQGND